MYARPVENKSVVNIYIGYVSRCYHFIDLLFREHVNAQKLDGVVPLCFIQRISIVYKMSRTVYQLVYKMSRTIVTQDKAVQTEEDFDDYELDFDYESCDDEM